MSREYDEKRDFFRMAADCALNFKIQGDSDDTFYTGQCVNLSAGGVLFRSETKLDPGCLIEINITPDKSVVPPLQAVIEVARRDDSSEATQFEYAGSIKQLL